MYTEHDMPNPLNEGLDAVIERFYEYCSIYGEDMFDMSTPSEDPESEEPEVEVPF